MQMVRAINVYDTAAPNAFGLVGWAARIENSLIANRGHTFGASAAWLEKG